MGIEKAIIAGALARGFVKSKLPSTYTRFWNCEFTLNY